jgi:hypothetical protein
MPSNVIEVHEILRNGVIVIEEKENPEMIIILYSRKK